MTRLIVIGGVAAGMSAASKAARQAKSSGMHPVTIIAALLICNYLWGTVGMFISVPVAGLVKLLLTQTLQVIRQL